MDSETAGNLRFGLAQSSMMKSLVHSGSSTALWKNEGRSGDLREAEIAKMNQRAANTSPSASKAQDGYNTGAASNFKLWLHGSGSDMT